ncbi:hypothetical protein [Pseudemcibacter aquimaris]|uniref:hypothetical protein n=1 Tax=Pseudemcibacter aquimaris TaxID=2857064 RepID=UPI002012B22B|nr:hypothetical protein [Pseudemcibacter aquimaris]MCC3860225.1 hypothetical protein [Pseudemcibacter aquimaris]WDU57550.1 hypothetical protein KW060_10120 [Pseudemcibacter aquimaris]
MLKQIFIFLFFLVSQPVLAQESERNYRTGEFDVKSTIVDLLGEKTAKSYEQIFDADEELLWNVFVPANFTPENAAGVIVYFSDKYPNQVESGWKGAAEEKNFIWVSPKRARNFTNRKKLLLGVLATPLIESLYPINGSRVYVTGDRSGCDLASNAARIYPNIFSGAIYNSCKAETWKKELPPGIDLMRKHRYVFIASARSENNREIRRSLIKYNKSGIENTQFKLLSSLDGNVKLNNNHIRDIVAYLDGDIESVN